VAQPGYADALTDGERRDAWSDGVDSADNFMPGNDGQVQIGKFAVDHVQVGAADAACQDVDPDFSRTGRPVLKFRPLERLPTCLQYHCMHDFSAIVQLPA